MSDAAEADLMGTERRWVQAHRDLNLAEIEDILDAGYKRIVGDRVINKEDLLASYRSGKRHWDLAEGSDYSIQVHGSFAIVVGTWRGIGVNHGNGSTTAPDSWPSMCDAPTAGSCTGTRRLSCRKQPSPLAG